MKKYFLIILLLILSSCISRYKTSTLFEDGGYKYNITYPVSKHNEWSLFYGNTDATMYELENGTISCTTNIITKQKPTSDCAIEVFLVNKNSMEYKSIYKSLNDGFGVIFLNIQDKKRNFYFEDIYNWIKNKDNKMLSVVYEIGNNKVIQFIIDEDSNNKKKTGREIYKIINSLTREKINDNDKKI